LGGKGETGEFCSQGEKRYAHSFTRRGGGKNLILAKGKGSCRSRVKIYLWRDPLLRAGKNLIGFSEEEGPKGARGKGCAVTQDGKGGLLVFRGLGERENGKHLFLEEQERGVPKKKELFFCHLGGGRKDIKKEDLFMEYLNQIPEKEQKRASKGRPISLGSEKKN